MLYQDDTGMLFPARVIPALRNLRSPEWQELIDHLTQLPHHHPNVLGFVLMMVRLGRCMTCDAGSYRAMRGCTLCAQQAVSRFKGSDLMMVKEWQVAREDILLWMNGGPIPETS